MATTNLEFTKLNASLQVGDYVFSSSTQTNGAYSVQGVSSFINGDIQLGRVKSITTPTSTSGYVIEVQLDNATILPSASDYFYFVKDSRVNQDLKVTMQRLSLKIQIKLRSQSYLLLALR